MSLKQWHTRASQEGVVEETKTSNVKANRRTSTQFGASSQVLDANNWDQGEGDFVESNVQAPQVDAAMWQNWEEKEGDEDDSGDIAMLCGDLDHDKNCIDNRKKFHPDAKEGWVVLKSSDTPGWAAAYGYNIGASRSGHCVWEVCVIMRMGNMYIGVVNADGMRGELDRRWDSSCFRDQTFYWATTGGCLMNGPDIIKNLPTTKVPVCHFNYGDIITLDLKVNPAKLRAKVVEVSSSNENDDGLSFITNVKLRLDESLSAQHIRQNLPPVYEMPTLFFESRVYHPFDYVKRDMTFRLRMRRLPKLGEAMLFECTGDVTFFHNGLRVGAVKGVPGTACPAVCMSGKGDMVRLHGPCSGRDQADLDRMRAALVKHAAAARNQHVRAFALDRDLLRDWVLLKALRWNRYDAAAAVGMVREYCERRARGALREALGRQQLQRELTEYTEDYTVSDRFAMADPAGSGRPGGRWRPRSIEEALDWDEEEMSQGSDDGEDDDDLL